MGQVLMAGIIGGLSAALLAFGQFTPRGYLENEEMVRSC